MSKMSIIEVPVILENSITLKQARAGENILIEKNVFHLIDPSWKEFFFGRGYRHNQIMMSIYKSAYSSGYRIVPKCDEVYKVFSMPVDAIRVVIVGQDPYPGFDRTRNTDVACGLSFATESMETPCSLKRIREAVNEKFGNILIADKTRPNSLQGWINQGVFLMNNTPVLAVPKEEEKKQFRPLDKIWDGMTSEICKYISSVNPKCHFILVGSRAHYLEQYVPRPIKTSHPSTRSSLDFTGDCFISVDNVAWNEM
jgi:uracil-DNA glycosylase